MPLTTILLFILFPVISFSQKEYKVTSIDSVKGMTVFFTCMREVEGQQYVIRGAWITFKGMDKKPDLTGRIVKHYPNGYGRRKTIFVLQPKK